ncbi:MAG TPA: tyrosine--tRNA ligase [Candidatus Sulfotelmatobacter sp.]|jgi:tyrosyl-tRNA synthetase|nr:tyrosine--tRNA ligase [Candidatus Sulfotelmatobacter sp.]
MDSIEELLTRGVANIIPGKKELEEKLRSGEKLNIYLGIDPTSTKIHLGHAVVLRKLQAFNRLGHHVTFLIGDFTALIGDTSDKDTERPVLTTEEIKQNLQTYKKQAEKILDFSKVIVKHNSEWLKQLSFEDVVKLTQHFSVGDFVGRELIRKRLNENKRVGLHEFLYPVMQGYDSYFMDTDIQLGGTDQTFNMQAGRTLQKDLRKKQSYVLTTTILEGTDGRKMSKSWGNAIWLDDTAEDIYAKVMAITDELIINYYTLASNVSLAEITEAEAALKNGEHPMTIKKELAFAITKELTSLQKAEAAKENFAKRVQRGEKPEEMPTVSVTKAFEDSRGIIDVLLSTNLAKTRSDAKRLTEQGGVEIIFTKGSKKINDIKQLLDFEEGMIIKVGKRKFVKLVLEK